MKVALSSLLLLLAILKNSLGADLTDISDMDCDAFLTCTDCVSTQSSCDWCIGGHSCTHDTNEDCPNDILVTGANKTGPDQSRLGLCPTINPYLDGKEILVPTGTTKTIKVKVRITSQFIVQTRFSCQFLNSDGRVTSVNAQLLGDTLYCDPMEFVNTSKSSNLTLPFSVIWGGNKPLDNPDNIHVVVYRCKDMGNNCGTCLALPEKYNCGWCQSTSACEVSDQCKGNANPYDWINRSRGCPSSMRK